VRLRAGLKGVNVMVNSHQISARLRPSDYGAQPSQPTLLIVVKLIPFIRAGLPAVACLLAKAGGEGRNRTEIAAFFKTHYSPTTALPPEAYRLITNERQ
jgi:hypothetical protein